MLSIFQQARPVSEDVREANIVEIQNVGNVDSMEFNGPRYAIASEAPLSYGN